MKRLILVAGLLLAASACNDESRSGSNDNNDDNAGSNGSNEPIAGSFTAFVLDLVNNHTVDDAAPMDYATFELLPDPDGDSNNVDAYRPLF